jgi:uncharacterized protein (TIGR02246 family)
VEAIQDWLAQTITAYNSGDAEAALALYADETLSMPPLEPPMDTEQERATMQAFFSENDIQIAANADDIVVAGDLGVLRATYSERWTPKAEGEAGEQRGTWLVILRKQADGSWKLWRDMWTSETPPPEPESTQPGP